MEEWSVEFRGNFTPRVVTEDHIDGFVTALVPVGGVVSYREHWYQALFTIDADTLDDATAVGLKTFNEASAAVGLHGVELTHLRVIPFSEL